MTEGTYLALRFTVGLLFMYVGIREVARAIRAMPIRDSQTGSLFRELLSLKRSKVIRNLIGVMVLIVGGLHTMLLGCRRSSDV